MYVVQVNIAWISFINNQCQKIENDHFIGKFFQQTKWAQKSETKTIGLKFVKIVCYAS